MKKVVAALDNSLAGRPVIDTARALAAVLDAEVEAVHVLVDGGGRTAWSTARAAGVPLRTVQGPVVESLAAAGAAEDVVAVSIGARGTPSGRPLGSTAAAVATALRKPVVIVPPDASAPPAIRKVLVPLEGRLSAALTPGSIFEVALDATLDVVALHIHDEASLPAFTDQPQHEQSAWTEEFLRRYCPWGLGAVRLETRVGRVGELVPLVAAECGCDLIALGWSRRLSPGRAPVVRETLERSHLPVLLVPVEVTRATAEDAFVFAALGTVPNEGTSPL